MSIEFQIYGKAAPAGSKSAMPIYSGKAGSRRFTGKVAVVDSSGKRGKDWRTIVQDRAMVAMLGKKMILGPVLLHVTFQVQRPKGHYGTGRNSGVLKGSTPKYPIVRPDVTKLLRALEDAITGICWKDDSQVIVQIAKKVYGESNVTTVEIREYE